MSVDVGGPARELRPSGWKRSLPWLPSALLVLVALIQITLTRTVDLDPWKGGGFGMFATVDGISSRQLRATALAGSRWVPLGIPKAYVFEIRHRRRKTLDSMTTTGGRAKRCNSEEPDRVGSRTGRRYMPLLAAPC